MNTVRVKQNFQGKFWLLLTSLGLHFLIFLPLSSILPFLPAWPCCESMFLIVSPASLGFFTWQISPESSLLCYWKHDTYFSFFVFQQSSRTFCSSYFLFLVDLHHLLHLLRCTAYYRQNSKNAPQIHSLWYMHIFSQLFDKTLI